jgi:excisionase family DNA binding protein
MAEDTLIDRSNPLPTESGRGVTISMESWLAWRRAAGRHIDPATAEVTWWYAQTLDPYGVCPDLPEEYRQVGREYFARSPGDDLWISFCDLPEATRETLWEKHSSNLAFPAGLTIGTQIATDSAPLPARGPIVSIREACAIAGIGRTSLYKAIRAGELRAIKVGRRTFLLRDDIGRWLEGMPAITPQRGLTSKTASEPSVTVHDGSAASPSRWGKNASRLFLGP